MGNLRLLCCLTANDSNLCVIFTFWHSYAALMPPDSWSAKLRSPRWYKYPYNFLIISYLLIARVRSSNFLKPCGRFTCRPVPPQTPSKELPARRSANGDASSKLKLCRYLCFSTREDYCATHLIQKVVVVKVLSKSLKNALWFAETNDSA